MSATYEEREEKKEEKMKDKKQKYLTDEFIHLKKVFLNISKGFFHV